MLLAESAKPTEIAQVEEKVDALQQQMLAMQQSIQQLANAIEETRLAKDQRRKKVKTMAQQEVEQGHPADPPVNQDE